MKLENTLKTFLQNRLEKNNMLKNIYYFGKNPFKNLQNLFPDTYSGAKHYNSLMKLLNFISYVRSVSLRRKFLKKSKNFKNILPSNGFAKINFKHSKDLTKVIKLSKKSLNDSIKKEFKSTNQKKDFLLTKNINVLKDNFLPLRKLIISNDFLSPITEYLGSFPILWSSQVWFSPNKKFTLGRSQNYHMDNEDYRQIKCFIPLENINDENGPLTIIDANKTMKIFERLKQEKIIKYKHAKISDEIMYKLHDKNESIKLTAKVGEILYVDTSRCYHYGSRPSPKSRKVLFLQFFSINSRKVKVFQKKYNQNLLDNIEREIYKFYNPDDYFEKH